MAYITDLFNHYGYIVLFVALTLELIALPTPGETLMTYCGYLVFKGKLSYFGSIATATSGVIVGITISYFLGRKLGSTFFAKYGPYVHLGPDKLDKTSKWFNKYGNGLLVVAYYIPGVRHVTGYFSGVTKIPYRKFAINAYIGAVLWPFTFISLGKTLGNGWNKFHGPIKKYLIIGGIITAAALLCVYMYKNYKEQVTGFLNSSIESLIRAFRTSGRIRAILLVSAQAAIALSILLTILVKDLWEREFVRFDRIISHLAGLIFSEDFSDVMKIFGFLTSPVMLAVVTILLSVWIHYKGKNKVLELIFLLSTVLGGEVLEELLRLIFRHTGPSVMLKSGFSQYTFPSEQALMSVALYGFAAFIICHHIRRKRIGTAATFTVIFLCFLSGLSPIYFRLQYPSDVLIGYIFGDVWLSLNIILLEVFRILSSKQPSTDLQH